MNSQNNWTRSLVLNGEKQNGVQPNGLYQMNCPSQSQPYFTADQMIHNQRLLRRNVFFKRAFPKLGKPDARLAKLVWQYSEFWTAFIHVHANET
jgi:hypothetical protein